MRAWAPRALTALCVLRHLAGHAHLPPPQNVTLLSKGFDMILTWMPGEGSPPDVTYTVRCESQDRMGKWIKVPHCKNIPSTSCNLTCALPDFFIKFRARVKATAGGLQSLWVESEFREYHLDVELAPPGLDVSVRQTLLLVNASFPLATCVESFHWMYDLDLWEAGSEKKKRYENIFRKNTLKLDTTALSGNYCLSARSSFQSIDFKHSKFSQPVCVLLNHRAAGWKFPFLAMAPAFVLPILLTGVLITCLLKQGAGPSEPPPALDFSHFTGAAGTAFQCELSEEELPGELICTERPISQGSTTRTRARSNLPWRVSFLSSSSEEEEEEEEGDSGTFIPYTKMSKFPRKSPKQQLSRTAEGESSSDSGSGGLCVDDGSVLDLTSLGFSFLPTGKEEVYTAGCQGNANTSLFCRPSLGSVYLDDGSHPGPGGPGHGDKDGAEHVEMSPPQTLAEERGVKPQPAEQFPHGKDHHFGERQPKRSAGGAGLGTKDPQLSEGPHEEQLVCLWTLQVAEDEGIASDCDSDSFTEGTPPACTALSDAGGTSNVGENYGQKLQIKGAQHIHYMARS